MWPFKPFMPKEQTGLDGRTIVVGNMKVHIRNAIAEGGFSCVYLARDAVHSSKQYAVKHMICNDQESLDLVLKEISVMKLLKGHPNIVSLLAHTVLDMGRTKEALLVMEFCEKSLVNVLEIRGSGYFEEKQIRLIFRDICNAVFAMHCQSPPIAHRDLKAENLLVGPDGLWKLCDFGSTSTNHKRFEKPEEMGIEEDTIRKHTTPAYRAPEMWDMFRRETISEKVDIWALGCLLYRICYFKSAFDGESKLQILNGNYRIPDLPKFSSSLTELIRDMLHASPDARPDITQVWFRVNEQIPFELQKSLPDRPPEMNSLASDMHEGISNPANKPLPMPHRSPPPPPSKEVRNVSPPSLSTTTGSSSGALGAFWSSLHADSISSEDKGGPVFDEEPTSQSASKREQWDQGNYHPDNASHPQGQNVRRDHPGKNAHGNIVKKVTDNPSKDFEIRFFREDANHGTEKTKASQSENTVSFQNETFNTFVAEFDNSKFDSGNNTKKSVKEEELEAEVNTLKEELSQTNLEKAQITSKYEKLSAICRSQWQEIQELKKSLVARTPSPNKDDSSKNHSSPGSGQSTTSREKIEGTVWELQPGMFGKNSPSPDTKEWQAFPEEPKPQVSSKNAGKSVRTTNGHQSKQTSALSPDPDNWGFETDSFTAVPGNAQLSRSSGQSGNSQRFVDIKGAERKQASQPAGWAGF